MNHRETAGWVPVGDGSDDQWHREAWEEAGGLRTLDGTYELIGRRSKVTLKVHVAHAYSARRHLPGIADCPRD